MTPEEGGALAFIESVLGEAGFEVHRPVFSEPGTPDVENLYARFGTGQPYLLFAGHTDVVPPGDVSRWRHDPFGGEIDGRRALRARRRRHEGRHRLHDGGGARLHRATTRISTAPSAS